MYGVVALLVIMCSLVFYFSFERIIGLKTFFAQVIDILMPVIWGIVIAYLLSPVYNYFHRHLHALAMKKMEEKNALKFAKGVSILISILFFLALIYALIALIVPQLVTSIRNIIDRIPLYVVEIRGLLRTLFENFPELQDTVLNTYNNLSDQIMNWFGELDLNNLSSNFFERFLPDLWSVVSSVSSGVYRVVTFLLNFIIGIIVAVYLLATKKLLCGQMKRIIYSVLPNKAANLVVEKCRYAHKAMSGFISGKILDSLIIGLICFIGTSILNIPYALLVSVIIGLTNIIPFFGPFIGAVPCALFILLNSPIKCLVFVIFVLLLQQFDGNILGPKILGESTGLSSFWVITSLLLFGGLFGIVGMIVGVPIFAVVYHLIAEATRALLKKKKMSADTKDYILLDKVEGELYIKLPDPSLMEEYQPEGEKKHQADEPDNSNEAET